MLQIQPGYRDYEEWAAFAQREGLFYEALAVSMPPLLCGGGEAAPYCDKLRASGRLRSLHGAFIDVDPASGDDDMRAVSRRRCAESCALAVSLGAENVVFHSSCFPFLRGAFFEKWADECAAFYQSLAQTYGLRIFIENSMDVDPQPLAALMRRISDKRIGVCLDFGHANYSRVPVRGWFEALGGRIGYLHLSDNAGAFDDHLPLGDGSIDWEEADSLRKSLGRDVPMTLEVGGIDGVARSLRYMRERGLFGYGGD